MVGCRCFEYEKNRGWRWLYCSRIGVNNVPARIFAKDSVALGVTFESNRRRGTSRIPVRNEYPLDFHIPPLMRVALPKERPSHQTEISAKALATCAWTALSPLKKLRRLVSIYWFWDPDHWVSSRCPQVIGVAVDLIESVRGQDTGVGSGDLQDVHFRPGAPSNDSRVIADCPSR